MSKKKYKSIIGIAFIVYLSALLYVLLLKGNLAASPQDFTTSHRGSFYLPSNYNIMPFQTIRLYLKDIEQNQSLYSYLNLFGNFLIFLPFGFLLPFLTNRRQTFFLTFLSGTFLIILVEVIQLISLWGIFDVDDYILNILGVIIGWLIQKALIRR